MSSPQPWNKEIREVEDEILYYKNTVSKFMHQARINICNSCEFFNNGMCMQCGCLLEVKLLNADEQCPIHKW